MKKIIFLLLIISYSKIFGQVNLQTGSATFTLPMFSWQDNKSRLNSVVALNYSSGNGLKVNDISSNAGQGWNLLAGGMITRIQHGEPDDQFPRAGNGTIEDVSKYPPGFLYDPVAAETGAPRAQIWYPIFKDKNHIYKQHNSVAADKELDHFAFQFNGRTGIFVLNKNSYNATNNSWEGVSLGENKLIINFVTENNLSVNGKSVRTTIKYFTIRDENGLTYKFATPQLTKVLRTSNCDKGFTRKIAQPKFKNNRVYYETSFEDGQIVNPYVINGWYLTEISDTLTHTRVSFTYDIRTITSTDDISMANYSSDNTGIFTPSKNYSVITRSKSIAYIPFITSISYPDGHNVSFTYDNKDRIDLAGDMALSWVNITYRGRYLSRYKLTTSYFILNRYGNPVSDYQKKCARLCLRSVKKIGVDLKGDDPPYVFDYFLGSSATDDFVPPPFFHLKDIWGFYNGNNSKDATTPANFSIPATKPLTDLTNNDVKGLCFNGSDIYSAKPGYAKNGLLRQITYPTGGSLNYDYAQNYAIRNGQNNIIGGVNVSKTSVTDGGYQNDCNNAIITNYSYTLDGTVSSYWGFEAPKNSMLVYNSYVPKDKYFYYKIFPPSFGCDFRYKYPGILSKEQAVNISWQMKMVQLASNIYNTISVIKDILKAFSSNPDPTSLIISVVIDIVFAIVQCTSDGHIGNSTQIYYNTDFTAVNPLPGQFKRVEVIEGNGSNGKTVHEFTSPDQYSLWAETNPLYSAKQRYAYWTYGLPWKTTVLNAAGERVKQTENVYDFSKAQRKLGTVKQFYGEFRCCKSLVEKSTSLKYSDWSDPSVYNDLNSYITEESTDPDIKAERYYTYTGRTELQTTYERVYKPGSTTQYLETRTDYDYTDYNYQVASITTTQSNGDVSFKNIAYAGEVTDNTGKFFANNILNVPNRITTGFRKNGSTEYKYTSEKLTEFTLANNNLLPSRILEKRVSQPAATLSTVPYKEIQTFTYDAQGNLIGMKDEGNHVVANIYGYDDKYVIASVVNAEPVADKPAYTSFEDFTATDFGGWILNGTAQFIVDNTNPMPVTGRAVFQMTSAKTFTANTNSAKAYTLSFWADNNGITVNANATLVKSAPVINGFTYYEYNIQQGSTSVSITGNANIDELRLYPKTSRMRTVTYDPLIGKTSECDENNRITYYEYDDNSRLRFIKDENRHIVKMYEYNIAKKPTGCPVTYSNLAVSEIFTRQCAAGYQGGGVEYVIPAGKYTSTISQDAVDLKVQNELDTYGQAYANTQGTCSQIFYNPEMSVTFTKEDCPLGYEGTSYTYTVPAGTYWAIIKPGQTAEEAQAEANEQAQDDIDANGQMLANLPGNTTCVVSYAPVWEGTGIDQCSNGHRLVQVKDLNPNSSTYNQTQWIDTGTDASCGSSACESSSCIGQDKRCVNGYCEQGYKVYTGSAYDETLQRWICTYHYEWSDGYWSQDYTEYSNYACPIL